MRQRRSHSNDVPSPRHERPPDSSAARSNDRLSSRPDPAWLRATRVCAAGPARATRSSTSGRTTPSATTTSSRTQRVSGVSQPDRRTAPATEELQRELRRPAIQREAPHYLGQNLLARSLHGELRAEPRASSALSREWAALRGALPFRRPTSTRAMNYIAPRRAALESGTPGA